MEPNFTDKCQLEKGCLSLLVRTVELDDFFEIGSTLGSIAERCEERNDFYAAIECYRGAIRCFESYVERHEVTPDGLCLAAAGKSDKYSKKLSDLKLVLAEKRKVDENNFTPKKEMKMPKAPETGHSKHTTSSQNSVPPKTVTAAFVKLDDLAAGFKALNEAIERIENCPCHLKSMGKPSETTAAEEKCFGVTFSRCIGHINGLWTRLYKIVTRT